MKKFTEVYVGETIGPRLVNISRTDLVRYAAASGDFNPIHWNDEFAKSVDLPGVIAHGMYTMGQGLSLITDWAGSTAAIIETSTKFTRPIPVANDLVGEPFTQIQVFAEVIELLPDKKVKMSYKIMLAEKSVLGKALAVVQFAE